MSASFQALMGIKVGHFLSPHVHKYNERIFVGGQMISDSALLQIRQKMDWLEKTQDLPKISYFQHSFLEAMAAFKDLKLAVIECGVGGREDATNILSSEAAVISRIGMDHMNSLGNSIEEIAGHKAGILTDGKPLISSDQLASVRKILLEEAEKRRSPAYFFEKDWISNVEFDLGDLLDREKVPSMKFSYSHDWLSGNYEIRLLGLHQLENVGTALLALEELADPKNPISPSISSMILSLNRDQRREIIKDSLKNVYLPGRLEIISRDPFILIDGAHNDPAILNLIKNLNWLGLNGKKFPRPALIFGMHHGKIHKEVLDQLFARVDRIYPVEVEGKEDKEREIQVGRAISKALREDPHRPLLICGSLYLLDGASVWLKKNAVGKYSPA